ncbi:Formin-like protein 3 [Linum perenne]
MIESLFGYTAANKNKSERRKDLAGNAVKYIHIIDPRKAQNLSILLRALNVTTEEVLDALREASELPVELLQTLLKMAPTADEELKLRLYTGEMSQLGPAERFLKALVEVPFAFKRIESLLFMSSLQEEVTTLKEAFATLEVASNKLRNSRLFLKLLEAVLKTGNRMNDGTYRGGALAFKLDTLLKLSDVKGTDGKTTLLHFVVLEIIRSEGIRAVRSAKANAKASSSSTSEDLGGDDPTNNDQTSEEEHYCNLGLQVVASLSNDFEEVKNAALLDSDMLSSTLSKLRQSFRKAKGFVESDMKSDEESEFYSSLVAFMDRADSDISWLSEEEKRITALVKSTADYFHGKSGKEEGLRLFIIVRSFLTMLDKACKEVQDARAKKKLALVKVPPVSKESPSCSAVNQPENHHLHHHKELFPAIAERRSDSSFSSDDDGD